jgi:hypothetical protein
LKVAIGFSEKSWEEGGGQIKLPQRNKVNRIVTRKWPDERLAELYL